MISFPKLKAYSGLRALVVFIEINSEKHRSVETFILSVLSKVLRYVFLHREAMPFATSPNFSQLLASSIITGRNIFSSSFLKQLPPNSNACLPLKIKEYKRTYNKKQQSPAPPPVPFSRGNCFESFSCYFLINFRHFLFTSCYDRWGFSTFIPYLSSFTFLLISISHIPILYLGSLLQRLQMDGLETSSDYTCIWISLSLKEKNWKMVKFHI